MSLALFDGGRVTVSGDRARFAEDAERLTRSPHMQRAARRFAKTYVALFRNRPLLNLIISDRGRLFMAWMALYFDAGHDPADPNSGLTVNRFKAACAETGLCSPGRAAAMLGIMRFAGQIEPVGAARRGHALRLVPTEKLRASFRERLENAFAAMTYVVPEGNIGLNHLGDPVFETAFVRAVCEEFLARERPIEFSPRAKLFFEGKAGILILCSLILSTDDEGLPTDKTMTASIAQLSRAFSVSRPQIKDLLNRAVVAGSLIPEGEEVNRFRLAEDARDDVMRLLASFWVIAACAVRAGVEAATCAEKPKVRSGQARRV